MGEGCQPSPVHERAKYSGSLYGGAWACVSLLCRRAGLTRPEQYACRLRWPAGAFLSLCFQTVYRDTGILQCLFPCDLLSLCKQVVGRQPDYPCYMRGVTSYRNPLARDQGSASNATHQVDTIARMHSVASLAAQRCSQGTCQGWQGNNKAGLKLPVNFHLPAVVNKPGHDRLMLARRLQAPSAEPQLLWPGGHGGSYPVRLPVPHGGEHLRRPPGAAAWILHQPQGILCFWDLDLAASCSCPRCSSPLPCTQSVSTLCMYTVCMHTV